jgi:hypothetical protein
MVTIHLAGLDYARVRFAISPLWESVAALRAQVAAQRAPISPWVARLDRRLRPLPLPLLRRLVDPAQGYLPDFLAPPPTEADADFMAELAVMRRTPSEVVARELARAGLRMARAEVREALPRLADEIRHLWENGVRPDWAELHAILERDIVFRARQLARDGIERVLAGLHPGITTRGQRVQIASPTTSRCAPKGRGLMLVPSVFAWPDVFVVVAQPWRPTIAYPTRGVALVLEPVPTVRALELLAGATRARVLLASRNGATTGEIAAALRLTSGAVSHQVVRLRAAGLVRSLRAGHFVIHELTARGKALVAACGQ